jgi:peptide/nickel transport system permease protein
MSASPPPARSPSSAPSSAPSSPSSSAPPSAPSPSPLNTPPSTPRRAPHVTGHLLRLVGVRLVLAIATLWLLSVLVFAGAQLLPGDVGRAMLGPLADARAVAALNHQLGADRPAMEQYLDWTRHLLHGDLGQSTTYRAPVAPFIGDALINSLKLGALAFIIVVPLGIGAGVAAALYHGRWLDRLLAIIGLCAAVVPEFVSSVVLILIFGVWLHLLPIQASFAPDASIAEQLSHLILPALPLVFIFFGYIARMARAGTIEALSADYTRTAVLKGLPARTVLWTHVLRNGLAPTITVATTQLGYMIGGLVVVETLFHYQGIGSLIYNAAKARDFPMLEAGVLVVGAVYTIANLLAELLTQWLYPQTRDRGSA